jgi:hypothetical protein
MRGGKFWLSAVIIGVGSFLCAQAIQAQCVDSMIVAEASGYAGENSVVVPVYGTVCGWEGEDLDGFTTPLVWNTSAFELDTALYEVTDPVYSSFYDEIADPNTWAVDIHNDEGWAIVAGVFRYGGEPDISPGRYRMFDLVFNVREAAIPGEYTIELAEDIGTPPKDPTFTYYYYDVPVDSENQVNGVFTVLERTYGTLQGTVVNEATSYPLPATVKVDGFETRTKAWNGFYNIDSLPVGEYYAVAEAAVCIPDTMKPVVIAEDSVSVVDFGLICLDTLWLPDSTWTPEDTTFTISVFGKFTGWIDTNGVRQNLDALKISLHFPAPALSVDTVWYDVTNDTLPCLCDSVPDPDQFAVSIRNSEGWVIVAPIFDYGGVNDIPPGTYHLFDIDFISPPWSDTFSLQLKNAEFPYVNSITYFYEEGSNPTDVYPVLKGGKVFCPVNNHNRALEGLPKKYSLFQNFPNPFNPETEITYALPHSGNVKLEIFNILGERVRILVNSWREPGFHKVIWKGTDPNDNPVTSGVYFYRIKANDYTCTRRMILLR